MRHLHCSAPLCSQTALKTRKKKRQKTPLLIDEMKLKKMKVNSLNNHIQQQNLLMSKFLLKLNFLFSVEIVHIQLVLSYTG